MLGAPDPRALAGFYRRLLSWEAVEDEPDWVVLRPPGGGAGLSFQAEENYRPPVWPTAGKEQQTMLHLDVAVDDLDAAAARAVALGARLAEHQPQDHVRVVVDPAGHPFCLFVDG